MLCRLFRLLTVLLACFCLLGAKAPRHAASPPAALYFLNVPETVRHPGELAAFDVPAGQRVRVFFHYRNATGHRQPFTLRFSTPPAREHAGFALSLKPGKAGSLAVAQFLAGTVFQGDIRLSVPSEQTVSGIIEGTTRKSTRICAQLGEGGPLAGRRVLIEPVVERTLTLALSAEGATGTARIGDGPHTIDGDYGMTYLVKVISRATRPLRLTAWVSPRGSELAFAYALEDQVTLTPVLPAYSVTPLFSRTVQPGEVITLRLIPTGGYSLPIEVRFALSAETVATR